MTAGTASRFPFALSLCLLRVKIAQLSILFSAFGAFLLPIALLAMNPVAAHAVVATTTTTLAISSGTGTVTTVSAGTAITLTATVKAGATPVQPGLVKFCDATVAHCTDIHLVGVGQLTTSGSAVFQFIPGPGDHSYVAEFAGTAADAASSSSASALTVGGAPTTTTIAQSGSAGNYTLKATVTGAGSATGPTGKVSFLDTSSQNAVLGSADLGASTAGFTWTSPQSPVTAAQPNSVAVADFNGDGIPDIAIATNGTTASSGIGSVQVLLGNGDGTFQTAKTYTGLAGNQLLVAAPFVTGGAVDILVVNDALSANNGGTMDNGLLFTGDGKGGFTAGTPFRTGIDSISSIVTGDLNGDGIPDFALAGTLFNVSLFSTTLGNGTGTLGLGTVNAIESLPISLVALGLGDFNGDGSLDIAVVESNGTVQIFQNNSVGDFTPVNTTQAGSSPTAIAVGDFDGDGKADLAITNSGVDNVSILIGNGSGGFTAAASPSTGSTPKSIAVGDFNGDGFADLAVANSGASTVTILRGNGDGTFTSQATLNTGNAPVSVAVGTFNGNDTDDIAVANEDPASNASSSTATILLAQLSQTATATATGIAPTGTGTHLVDASYPGDGSYAASVSSTTSLSANTISTALALTANPTSIALGQQVLLTATLAPYSSGSSSTNGEMITFSNGSTSLGTGTLSSGVATLNTTSLPAGTDSVTATYAGDAHFKASTSSVVHVVVSAAGVPAANLSSSSLTFASQLVGSTSATKSITLTNAGQAALNISSITASGDFAETNTCGSSVAAGGMCSISVTFTPTTAGARSGTLTITDNASGSPQTVTLSGTGESVGLTSTTTALTISTPGGSAMATIQLSPLSGFTGTVNLTCSVTYQGTGTPKLPPTCTMSPAQTQITGNSGVSSTLTVSTSKNAASATGATGTMNAAEAYERALRNSGVVLAALFLFGIAPRWRWRKGLLFGFFCMMVVGGIVGCGSSSNQGTTPGSYQVMVTATSGSATASTTIPLMVQ